IEKDSYPGENKVCGGGLRAGLLDAFFIDKEIIEHEIRHMTFFGSEGDYAKIDLLTSIGATVDRKKFDNWLAERAVKEGAELRTNTQVESVIMEGKKARGVVAKDLSTGKTYKVYANVIVGADGIGSLVAKQAGFNHKIDATNTALCFEQDYILPSSDINMLVGDSFEMYFDDERVPEGYGWIFPKKNVLTVGVGSLMSKMDLNIKDHFNLFLQDERVKKKIAGAKPLNPKSHTLYFGKPFDKIVKNNVILVGSAAGLVGPFLGEGIYYALKSGELAGKQIVESNFSDVTLRPYEDKIKSEFYPFLNFALSLRRLLFKNKNYNKFIKVLEMSDTIKKSFISHILKTSTPNFFEKLLLRIWLF
ncbi:MAG: NAD(P)/FAD-dependent oxidoreductase, partial [Candidatus Diapherotrites archaeon]|nr:NAD(P)/FAD-dependent oxidoreductase [Candidatus Diapherotrites archaeon]